jgi:hypothetical protein
VRWEVEFDREWDFENPEWEELAEFERLIFECEEYRGRGGSAAEFKEGLL